MRAFRVLRWRHESSQMPWRLVRPADCDFATKVDPKSWAEGKLWEHKPPPREIRIFFKAATTRHDRPSI